MQPFVGLDFGTTNTAVGLATVDGAVRLAELPGADGGTVTTWPSVLFFDADGGEIAAGAPAIGRYLDSGGDGRLVQSIKSHLASASFTRTQIAGRAWLLEDMIAVFLRALRGAVGVELGRRCVVGRPVHYWGAEGDDDDARAVERMRSALARAGFDEVVFAYEPVGAAARYAARLDHDELIVVADFGGGTTDFSVIRVGPRADPADPKAVLASAGLGVSGDAFDARVIDAVVAPALGRGTSYRDEMGAVAPVPSGLYSKLRRWHHLSFLKTAETLRLLGRIEQGALAPQLIERLVRVVHDDLGLHLHRAVELAKVELSTHHNGSLGLGTVIDLEAPIARADFDSWIAGDLDAIDDVLGRALAAAGVVASEVDRVFATGGSSLVPAVRARLAARFGADKLVGGEELTSVAWGLAACARRVFA
ncbi:MAG TPA: Hsp70 family protein [Polyangia bacterium]